MPQPLSDLPVAPDFARFRDTLTRRRAFRRPPLFDFHVDARHKAGILGREVRTPADDVAFWRAAGYDYVQCTVHAPIPELQAFKSAQQAGAASHGSETGIIDDMASFTGRAWSWMADGVLESPALARQFEWLQGVARCLPPEMKILVHNADVFTYAWELVGFRNLCLKVYDEPELIPAIMQSLGAVQLAVTRRALELAGDAAGALFYSDDIAYTEGLMLAPPFYRQHLFPVMREFAELGRSAGIPLIYHSDGRLYDIFDDLAALGVRGIQPLEPKAMDPLEIHRRWPGRFCLMGNIDLDLMSRGSTAQVAAFVRDRVDTLNTRGGYMPGVSNTVPYYVNFENYVTMIRTVRGYPDSELAT